MNRLRHIATVIVATAYMMASAAAVDDARRLYHEGNYAAAEVQAREALRKTPKDGNANFFLGASLFHLGDTEAAMAPLRQAESRGVTEASQMLAEIALDRYDTDTADEHLERWSAAIKKAKKTLPESYSALTNRAMQLRNMLDRVEKIEVLDSLVVDSADFFSAYRLSPAAGRILPPDAVARIGAGAGADELSTAYIPENHSEVLWSAADSTGVYRLYGADILDDGTIDHAKVLDENLGDGGDAKYPFLMPDGATLYYANNGDNSLGGYDIFMTRRSDDGSQYFTGQNVGMPYNSPYDDYLLAIDETSGLGWWATDRNRIPGKVTVYVFAPAAVRENANPETDNVAALAALTDISLTRKPGVDYQAMLAQRLPAQSTDAAFTAGSPSFALDMGNGHIYTSLSDFRNDRARSAMLDALGLEATLRKHLSAEEELRDRYRRGDHSVESAILSSEHETADLRRRLATRRNSAIRLETTHP